LTANYRFALANAWQLRLHIRSIC